MDIGNTPLKRSFPQWLMTSLIFTYRDESPDSTCRCLYVYIHIYIHLVVIRNTICLVFMWVNFPQSISWLDICAYVCIGVYIYIYIYIYWVFRYEIPSFDIGVCLLNVVFSVPDGWWYPADICIYIYRHIYMGGVNPPIWFIYFIYLYGIS